MQKRVFSSVAAPNHSKECSEERVLAVVDGDNLYHYFANLQNPRLSPCDVIEHFVGNRQSIVPPIFFFSIDEGRPLNPQNYRDSFILMLMHCEAQGRLKLKTAPRLKYIKPSTPGHRRETTYKGYSDVDLAVEIYDSLDSFDTLLFFAGDSDYVNMIKSLKEKHNKRVELYYSGIFIRRGMIPVADDSIDMSETFPPHYPEHVMRQLEATHYYPARR